MPASDYRLGRNEASRLRHRSAGAPGRGWYNCCHTVSGRLLLRDFWRTTLGQPGLKGQNSQAFSVNASGQAVGEAQTGSPDPQGEDFCGFAALGLASSGTTCLAFVWQNGVMSPLPTLGGKNGVANQINSAGQAVGMAEK